MTQSRETHDDMTACCALPGCYSKLRTGYRHYSGYYQSHHHVREVAECEEECARARDCRSFSYR